MCIFDFENGSNADDFDYKIKLLVLGDSGVGKSSLLLRFSEGKFDANFVITIGVDFKTKTIVNVQRIFYKKSKNKNRDAKLKRALRSGF